jgi:hypothetical protein
MLQDRRRTKTEYLLCFWSIDVFVLVLSAAPKSHMSANDVVFREHWELQPDGRLLSFLLFDALCVQQRPRDTLARQVTRYLSKQYFSYAVAWQQVEQQIYCKPQPDLCTQAVVRR